MWNWIEHQFNKLISAFFRVSAKTLMHERYESIRRKIILAKTLGQLVQARKLALEYEKDVVKLGNPEWGVRLCTNLGVIWLRQYKLWKKQRG